MSVNSIENELIILTKQTIDIFLRSSNPADIIALYTFYYYTAKWQETNQPKCTTGYVSNGLKWSEPKVRKAKKELLELGLIEDIQKKDDSGKIIGHYIKLNYIIKQSTIQPVENPQGGKSDSVVEAESNALSSFNKNALSPNKENALSADIENIVGFLNEKAGTRYKASTEKTRTFIKARMREGFTVADFKNVIDKKCAEWMGDAKMEQFLRPETLFGTKFESYLNAPLVARKTYGQSGVEIKKTDDDDLKGIL